MRSETIAAMVASVFLGCGVHVGPIASESPDAEAAIAAEAGADHRSPQNPPEEAFSDGGTDAPADPDAGNPAPSVGRRTGFLPVPDAGDSALESPDTGSPPPVDASQTLEPDAAAAVDAAPLADARPPDSGASDTGAPSVDAGSHVDSWIPQDTGTPDMQVVTDSGIPDTRNDVQPPECTSGVCCDAEGHFFEEGWLCEYTGYEYYCTEHCGNVRMIRKYYRRCTGSSPNCVGPVEPIELIYEYCRTTEGFYCNAPTRNSCASYPDGCF